MHARTAAARPVRWTISRVVESHREVPRALLSARNATIGLYNYFPSTNPRSFGVRPIEAGAYLGAAVFGIGMAGYALLSEVVWADFFGRRHLGSIRGVTMVFQLAGNASGSLIAAFLYDLRGNYDDAFKVIIVLFLASVAMLSLARRPAATAG